MVKMEEASKKGTSRMCLSTCFILYLFNWLFWGLPRIACIRSFSDRCFHSFVVQTMSLIGTLAVAFNSYCESLWEFLVLFACVDCATWY